MTPTEDIDTLHWSGVPFVDLDVRHWGDGEPERDDEPAAGSDA